MNNEEKALELAEANIRVYENSQYDYAFYAIRDASVEMAQWKDQQFIKFLEDRMGDEISVKMIEEFKEMVNG